MRLLGRLLWVLALGVFPIAGCNEIADPTTGELTLTVTGRPVPGELRERVEGAQVCETDTANCVPTDANGEAKLQLPIGETSYTIELEGHGSVLIVDVMGVNGVKEAFGLARDERWVEQLGRVMMSPYPMRGTGAISLNVVPPFAGATFALVDATGIPWYRDEEDFWSPDFTETTSKGSGGFVEVSPGEFQINLGGTADGCSPRQGWLGEVANSVRFPVREGYATAISVNCPLP